MKIFLSSTFKEFRDERYEIAKLAGILSVLINGAEDWGDRGKSKEETLKMNVDKSDVVVLLVGNLYGNESKELGKSFTEIEINHAFSQGKRIFAYFRENKENETANESKEKQRKLEKFKKLIEDKIAIIPRYNKGDLTRLIALLVRDIIYYKYEAEEEAYDDGFL